MTQGFQRLSWKIEEGIKITFYAISWQDNINFLRGEVRSSCDYFFSSLSQLNAGNWYAVVFSLYSILFSAVIIFSSGRLHCCFTESVRHWVPTRRCLRHNLGQNMEKFFVLLSTFHKVCPETFMEFYYFLSNFSENTNLHWINSQSITVSSGLDKWADSRYSFTDERASV